jgi:catechol 2,3-dioxygenase-like lactoylglutathione lyase family enzyme
MERVITGGKPTMTEWGVIPSIRVRNMAEALAFYRGTLEFTLDSGGDDESNSSLTRGDAHVMIVLRPRGRCPARQAAERGLPRRSPLKGSPT